VKKRDIELIRRVVREELRKRDREHDIEKAIILPPSASVSVTELIRQRASGPARFRPFDTGPTEKKS
jgi:hypothetical protein